MDSPSPPAAPNPTATSTAQTQSNIGTAQANSILSNPNYTDIYGNTQTVTQGQPYQIANPDGTSSTVTQPNVTQTLSPTQQGLLNSQTGISQGLADIGTQELPQLAQQIGTPINGQNAQQATQQAYGDITSRLDPQWQQATNAQETALRNQGLVAGDEGYDNAMRDFNNSKNDAYTQANLSAMQFAPQAQQMDITGQSALLNELNALRTGAQVSTTQTPGYNASAISPTNTLAAQQMAYQGGLNNYNAGVGSANSFNSGLMSLAGTIGGAALLA